MPIDLPTLIVAEKHMRVHPTWEEDDLEDLVFVAPLEIGDVTVEALQLRGKAMRTRPEAATLFQLEYRQAPSRFQPIWRVEWRPITSHNNKGKGPIEYRYITIHGSHEHPFELNWITDDARLRTGNLPIAIPIEPDLPDFGSLVAFVAEKFRISNLETIQPPPWWGYLL